MSKVIRAVNIIVLSDNMIPVFSIEKVFVHIIYVFKKHVMLILMELESLLSHI